MLTDPLVVRRSIAVLGPVVPLVVGVGVVWSPVSSTLALVLVGVLAAMIWRVEWAVLAYVAAEPFSGYLQTLSSVSIKAIGLLVFAAWALRLVTRTRPVRLQHPAVVSALALVLALLAATALHPHGTSGLVVVSRYGSYLAILAVLVDTMRSGLEPVRVLRWFVASCALAATVGLVDFLGGGGRASGPQSDPNDLAFFLVVAIPLSVALWHAEPPRRRPLAYAWPVSTVLLALGLLATFSRGGLVGLAVVLVLGVALGQVRLRVLAGGAVLVAVAVGAIATTAPTLVHDNLLAKQHIAGQNVEDRFATWRIAAQMTADAPVLGLGPGGFSADHERYDQGIPVNVQRFDVAHEMYLEVSSELGLLGLLAFAAVLGYGLAGAWRAARTAGPERPLATGVCLSFAAALVAAVFLTEQYYLPIWLLVALGVTLDPRARWTR